MSEFAPVLTARIGKKNSTALATYVADGGYESWKKVLAGSKTGEWTPAKVTDMVKASGLRGRGGAGFPTGMKWTFVPPKEKRGGKPVYLLCNADESEPGTFKDRVLIEKDPHQILEGMLLASFALDVRHAYIYIRGEMVHGAEILNAAVDEAYAAGLLGTNVLGSGLDLDVTVRGDLQTGAHHTVEDTGLVLGSALHEALGDRIGIERYGHAVIPMDEARAGVAIDLSGRPLLIFSGALAPGTTGGFEHELLEEFIRAVASTARMTLHVSIEAGSNAHHIIEACFKGLGRALRGAIRIDPASELVPSTKGTLTL